MVQRRSRRAEIEALAAEVSHRRAPERSTGAGADTIEDLIAEAAELGAAGAAEAMAFVDELRTRLEDGVAETRDFVRSNPAKTLAAAFVLGLAVGRLWRW